MRLIKLSCIPCILLLGWIPFAYAEDQPPPFYPAGSGFFVNKGYVLTHSDNVKYCSQILLYGAVNGAGAVLATDTKKQPLALLRTDQSPPVAAVFRSNQLPLRLSNPLVLLGYKLDKAGESVMVTKKSQVTGIYTSQDINKAVLFDVVSMPSIYGGPLLDSSGNVVGMAAPGKPRKGTSESYSFGGKNSEQASFAISDYLIRQFLSENKIPFLEADSSFYYEPELIANNAKKYTVHIRCSYQDIPDAPKAKHKKRK